MEESDYPALYQASDVASIKAQSAYLNSIKGYAALSIIGVGLSVVGIESKVAAVFAAVVFIAALFLSIFIAMKKNEGTWYRARAVAESIKTATWRFMMSAEPFESALPEQRAKEAFRELLHNILKEHKDLAQDLAGNIAGDEQLTERMIQVRRKSIQERKDIYLKERIEDQRGWYNIKAKHNKTKGALWFWLLISLQGVAVILTVLRIAYPEWKFWPTELFVVAGANVFVWIQLKRFRELAASYSLAAHEIGVAMGALDDAKSEDNFSGFVRDTENAFSREHTQWIAKKE